MLPTEPTRVIEVQNLYLNGLTYRIEVCREAETWVARVLQEERLLAEYVNSWGKAGVRLWACWRAHWEACVEHPTNCPNCLAASKPRQNA